MILYEMLVGRPPFRADGALEVMYAITHEAPAPVRGLRENMVEGLDQVVSHALEKDTSKRYQSASRNAPRHILDSGEAPSNGGLPSATARLSAARLFHSRCAFAAPRGW